MAEEGELKLDNQSGKKKKMMLIGIVLGVVLLGAVGGIFLLGGSKEEGEGGAAKKTPEEIAAEQTIHYVPVQVPFIFNAEGKPKGHLVQIKLTLMVRGDENFAFAQHHLPAIQNQISKECAGVQYADIKDGMGKQALKEKFLLSIKGKMKELEHKDIVEAILYDGFIVQ